MQSRMRTYVLRSFLLFDLLTDGGSSGTLPYDGVVHRPPGRPVPDKGRLSLIADPQNPDFPSVNPGLFHQKLHHADGILINLFRIMLHPAFFVDNLAVGKIRPAKKLPRFVEQKRFGSLRTLINPQHISRHVTDSPLWSLQFPPHLIHNGQTLLWNYR